MHDKKKMFGRLKMLKQRIACYTLKRAEIDVELFLFESILLICPDNAFNDISATSSF